MNPLFQLNGKRGLVVGLANELSIAYGCARMAVQQGAQVVASCVGAKALPYVQPLTEVLGISLHTCNVEEEGALEALVAAAVADLGGLDFVIHSIAWAPLADLHGKTINSSSEGFARAMDVSCHSFARLARLCVPHMHAGGTLVTMSYLGASEAVPNYGIMGPVKAALESLVRYMAVELGDKNIRVHAVSPGPILTRAASGIHQFDALMQHAVNTSALKRLVTLDEIAALSAFLVSDAASGMTGQTLYVDAGCHMTA